MLIMATILHLGKSSLPKKPITDDDVDRLSLCLKVLSECSPLMNDIFNKECRKSLSHMLAVRLEEEKLSQKVNNSFSIFSLFIAGSDWTQEMHVSITILLNCGILLQLINFLFLVFHRKSLRSVM